MKPRLLNLSKYSDALETVIAKAKTYDISKESIAIKDALNRTLAEDVKAKSCSPLTDNSSMDGYCLNSRLIAEASKTNPVILHSTAGIDAGHNIENLENGKCAYIATGAQLPGNADTVVKIEDVEINETNNTVEFRSPSKPGNFIRIKGKEYNAGDILVSKGELLTPNKIGLIASAGESSILVSKKPIVAILTSGDELVFPFEEPKPWQVRNANSSVLFNMVQECGATPLDLGIARDTGTHALDLLERAAELADVIVTSGGISMGRKDPFKIAFKQLNVKQYISGVRMKPGKPFFFGTLNKKPLFGLPGNQVSTSVTFELFVRPFLKLLLGNTNYKRFSPKLPLSTSSTNKTGRDFFMRANLLANNGIVSIEPLSSQESHMLTSISNASVLYIHPYDKPELAKGDLVDCFFIGVS